MSFLYSMTTSIEYHINIIHTASSLGTCDMTDSGDECQLSNPAPRSWRMDVDHTPRVEIPVSSLYTEMCTCILQIIKIGMQLQQWKLKKDGYF